MSEHEQEIHPNEITEMTIEQALARLGNTVEEARAQLQRFARPDCYTDLRGCAIACYLHDLGFDPNSFTVGPFSITVSGVRDIKLSLPVATAAYEVFYPFDPAVDMESREYFERGWRAWS